MYRAAHVRLKMMISRVWERQRYTNTRVENAKLGAWIYEVLYSKKANIDPGWKIETNLEFNAALSKEEQALKNG